MQNKANPAGWPSVRNKPNFRRSEMPIIPIFRYSTIPVRCALCETKPIGPVGPDLGGRIARNKPNFPAGGPGLEVRLCETKPNLGELGYLGDGAPGRASGAKRTQFSDCGLRIMSLRAKRGNLDCGLCETKPIRNKPGEIPHHSTIPSFRRSNPMPIVQNGYSGIREPICRRTRRCLRRSTCWSRG